MKAGVSNRAALEEDLERLVENAGGQGILGRCRTANVPEFRLVPLVQLWLEISGRHISARPPGDQASGIRVTIPPRLAAHTCSTHFGLTRYEPGSAGARHGCL